MSCPHIVSGHPEGLKKLDSCLRTNDDKSSFNYKDDFDLSFDNKTRLLSKREKQCHREYI